MEGCEQRSYLKDLAAALGEFCPSRQERPKRGSDVS